MQTFLKNSTHILFGAMNAVNAVTKTTKQNQNENSNMEL